MAIEAMKNGANCIIEKPAAPTVQDVKAMRMAENHYGKFVAVGFQAIYMPEIIKIKSDVLNGRIGTLKTVKVLGLWPRDSAYYGRNGWAGKICDAKGGWVLDSPFNNALAHYLNLGCFIAGTMSTKSAKLTNVRSTLFRCNPEIENADSATIELTATNGVKILFYATHSSDTTFGPIFEIQGKNGTITTNMHSVTTKVSGQPDEIIEIDNQRIRENLMDAVLKRVSNPSTFICDLDIAGTHVLAINGAHESSPIIPANPKDIERYELDDGKYRFVCRGLDKAMKTHFENGTLLDSSVYSWLSVGKTFPLTGYNEFNIKINSKK
jgi:predicted dehydrogenase